MEPYEFSFNEKFLSSHTKKQIKDNVKEVFEIIIGKIDLLRSGKKLKGQYPFPWKIFKTMSRLISEGTPETGVVVYSMPDEWDDGSDIAALNKKISGDKYSFSEALENAISDAKKKFQRYPNAKRLLIVTFYGDSDLRDEELITIIQETEIPSCIEEVWCTYHEWMTEWEYELNWRRII